MDLNREIILACESGIKELEAIRDYTEKLNCTQSEEMRQVYTDNRMDELPHIQNLVVALTALLNGEEPAISAQMDKAESVSSESEVGDIDGS
ncbi:MAG: hypothetical protein LBS21_01565 [Clostridiales bacterium]|nr:hypothetical protein [Clostridiales bacterium]